ncbi:MAG: DUF5074 domain-containing protein [Bacteroidaceae bacterium]
MKKLLETVFLLSVFVFLLTSCDTEDSLPPSLTLTSDLVNNAIVDGRSATFTVTVVSLAETLDIQWVLDGNKVGKTAKITLQIDGEGSHLLVVNVTNMAGTSSKTINFTATSKELAIGTIYTSIENNGLLIAGTPLTFTANIESTTDNTLRWILNGSEVSKDAKYIFTSEDFGEQELILEITNEDGITCIPFVFRVVGTYGSGTFVLNEGNMTSENGFVSFIDKQGQITDSVYYKVNSRPLGNTVQNMWVNDNHIYFISQNGGNMGGDMLVMANSQTLKQEAGYNDALSVLSWPTHVAAVNPEHVYIRDNKGVYLFNTVSSQLAFIDGTSSAAKNQMVVINDKIYVMAGSNVLVLDDNTVEKTIDMGATVSGLIKSYDGNLWVAVKSSPNKVVKVNPTSGEEMDSKEITISGVSAGWGATPGIGAYNNVIYFNNAETKVNKLDFITGICTEVASCKEISDNANTAYNNISVDPRNGDVYMHTLKGWGMDFLINDLFCWTATANGLELKFDLKDHTHFPTGCYFTKY